MVAAGGGRVVGGRKHPLGAPDFSSYLLQAVDYSAMLTCLNAVQAAGTNHADRVMAKLRSMMIDDMYTQGGYVRADGMMLHDICLFGVKKPSEWVRPRDYYKPVQTIPGEQAFHTLAESTCAMDEK